MTTTFTIDAEVVNAWAELSGDFNKLHVDPEFAAMTSYGRCIAHGPILASMVGEMLATEHGAPATIAYRFVGPVYVPSTVTAEVTPNDDGCAVTCTDDGGATVLTAAASWAT